MLESLISGKGREMFSGKKIWPRFLSQLSTFLVLLQRVEAVFCNLFYIVSGLLYQLQRYGRKARTSAVNELLRVSFIVR